MSDGDAPVPPDAAPPATPATPHSTAPAASPSGAPSRAPHVVLVGLPGAGKSVTGRRVARLLRRRFVDLDAVIERAAAMPIAAIFAAEGEAGFRARERAATAGLATRAPAVIAPGGGWVLDPANVAALGDRATIVWLRVDPTEAVTRMGAGIARRPLLAGPDPVAALSALLAARAPRYAAVADHVVESAGVPVDELARRVAALVARPVHRGGGRRRNSPPGAR